MLLEAKSPLLRCDYFHYASGLCHMGPEPPLAVRSFRMADEDAATHGVAAAARARRELAAAWGGRGAGLAAASGWEDYGLLPADGGQAGGGDGVQAAGGGDGGGGGQQAAGASGDAECKDWCDTHASGWEEKCGYFHCSGCAPCLDAAADPVAAAAAAAAADPVAAATTAANAAAVAAAAADNAAAEADNAAADPLWNADSAATAGAAAGALVPSLPWEKVAAEPGRSTASRSKKHKRGAKTAAAGVPNDGSGDGDGDGDGCAVCGAGNNCCSAGGSWFGSCDDPASTRSWEEGNAACLALQGRAAGAAGGTDDDGDDDGDEDGDEGGEEGGDWDGWDLGMGCNAAGDACVVHVDGKDVAAAAAAARGASAVLVFAAVSSSETLDRSSLALGGNTDKLVRAVAAANRRTAVCVVAPGAVTMPWRQEVAAITLAFLPGQAYGDALASLLLGEGSPSAKLPLTLPAEEGQPAFAPEQYPGTHEGPLQANSVGVSQPEAWWLQAGEGQQRVTHYSEGLLLGYRWFDAKNVTPAFAFGHGLSYTSFELVASSLNQSRDEVSCVLRNSGKRQGVETVQLYLGFPSDSKSPPLQLKGFAKTALGPGESTVVRFALTPRHRSTWDEATHAWAEVSGRVEVVVGTSSRDEAALRGHFVI